MTEWNSSTFELPSWCPPIVSRRMSDRATTSISQYTWRGHSGISLCKGVYSLRSKHIYIPVGLFLDISSTLQSESGRIDDQRSEGKATWTNGKRLSRLAGSPFRPWMALCRLKESGWMREDLFCELEDSFLSSSESNLPICQVPT